jgi:hypothetical protein
LFWFSGAIETTQKENETRRGKKGAERKKLKNREKQQQKKAMSNG